MINNSSLVTSAQELDLINRNLTALQQLLTAVALINEVNNTDTDFTNSLLPACTEEFLNQLEMKLIDIATAIGA